MFKSTLKSLAFILSFGLSACTPYIPSVGVNTAISAIQKELVVKGVVPVSNYQNWTGYQRNVFEYQVFNEQCSQQTPDPLVPVIAGPVNLGLVGSYTSTGSFQISASATSFIPGVSANASNSKTAQQSLSLPVQFVPLSTTADVEMQMGTERSGSILSQNSPARDARIAAIMQEHDAFAAYLKTLLGDYDPLKCTALKPDTHINPFVAVHFKP